MLRSSRTVKIKVLALLFGGIIVLGPTAAQANPFQLLARMMLLNMARGQNARTALKNSAAATFAGYATRGIRNPGLRAVSRGVVMRGIQGKPITERHMETIVKGATAGHVARAATRNIESPPVRAAATVLLRRQLESQGTKR
jgi:hypothetical protein